MQITDTVNDEQLMQAVLQQRDQQAFMELVKRWKQPLMAYFYRQLRQREISEELLQEVFVKVWSNRNYQSKGQFKAWIYRLAHNIWVDYLRKQKISVQELSEHHMGETQSPEEDLLANERIEQVHTALLQLPSSQRELLVMSRFHDLKHSEIADITGSSRNTVKVQIFRAIKNLAKKLKEVDHVSS